MPPKKNHWIGGLVLCVFPALVWGLARLEQKPLPQPWVVFLALLCLSGLWSVVSSVFELDADGAASWFVGSALTAGFALFAFLLAWEARTGDSAVFRILVGLGGAGSLVLAGGFFWKAVKRCRSGS